MNIKKSKAFLKYTILFLWIFFHILSSNQIVTAQNIFDQGVINYGYRNNGKLIDKASLKMYYKNGIVGYQKTYGNSSASKEKQYLNYNDGATYQVLSAGKGNVYFTKKLFGDYEKADLQKETENILGYVCNKAVLKIKSNTIVVWYTNELKIKGSPKISVAPGIGLILKMVRNRDYEIIATNIEFRKVTDKELSLNLSLANEVSESAYLRKVIESRYKKIVVFDHEQINFGDTIVNDPEDKINQTYRYSKGTVLLKKIKIPKIPKGSTVIAEINSWSNGDAYDRTGSLFIVPTNTKINFLEALKKGIDHVPVYKDKHGYEYQGVVRTNNYDPPLELIRFFTPFGVGGFNNYTKIDGFNWADSAKYSKEITELIPHEGKEVWIGVFIGNYDKGGHKVSVSLKIHPPWNPTEKIEKLWVKSIFNTVNIMEMSQQNYGTMFHEDSLKVSIEIPEGLRSLKLIYTSTGHGGWGGGDEFNPKMNKIIVDDELVYEFIPWRDDCGTYRLLNPSSGNFGNGLTSSDLSRSNWCPGATTIPEIISLVNISSGHHVVKISIPIGEKEGGSFSSWNVSGTLIGKFEE